MEVATEAANAPNAAAPARINRRLGKFMVGSLRVERRDAFEVPGAGCPRLVAVIRYQLERLDLELLVDEGQQISR
jgi:hypothetical protein